MAQSRLEKIGTIYSRTSSLLNSGAVKHKPIWYDVYEAFPPKYEPRWDRSPPLSKDNSKRKVLYEEDIIRARFYDHFQENIHETINLHDPESKCISQLFIEAYNATCVDIDDKSRFLAAVDTLELEKKTLI
ncbi:MRPS23 [Lepeophtheirus salmonis]|uniref:Small ribosomal subunit protein mS23 n=1 Tax=Lepeophtheirus salmonis TaxID=72036 RepID=A0A7R8CUP6_LEPSM|nr:MRPS23 [Lepeophtheirus salmonis]CAF2938572.1 MRPS23 [Lepeophtheirus salmonis]